MLGSIHLYSVAHHRVCFSMFQCQIRLICVVLTLFFRPALKPLLGLMDPMSPTLAGVLECQTSTLMEARTATLQRLTGAGKKLLYIYAQLRYYENKFMQQLH